MAHQEATEAEMKTGLSTLAALAVTATLSSAAKAAPVNYDDFQVGTTANLVALCTSQPTDPLFTAAQNFCHGFTVGTYRAIVAEEAGSMQKHKLFCIPAGTAPSRDQAIAAFVKWAAARPTTLASSPTDGIVEYLAAQYPCN